MTNILHIDSSAEDAETSYSRRVSAQLVNALRNRHPAADIVRLDVADASPPHVSGALRSGWTETSGDRSPPQVESVTRSEGYIEDLKAADIVVIGAPMYNFTVPSTLKAWIDHVVIAGQTFRYTDKGPVGLLEGKRAFLALARGGVYSEGPGKAREFQESYLRAVLGFMGITDVESVVCEGVALGPDKADQALAAAFGRANDLASV